ncbi:MAG: SDR family NAD(P)-dependent oxidoreductase [Sphingomonas fennica]
MPSLLVFGPGYTASRIAAALPGWRIETVGRRGMADSAAVATAIGRATHILSSVPPEGEGDPVLRLHGAALAAAPAGWIGYLSSTGVYGDAGGGWVDEAAPLNGRRGPRVAADLAWQALHPAVRVFRLPGIYGPGRSMLERVAEGKAHRIDLPGQVFSRIHVDDIVGGVRASIACGPAGVYNLADDRPAHQNDVVAEACRLTGRPLPPLQSLDEAGLSPMARAFYAENRRVAAGKARRLLGWRPLHADYRAGLRALSANSSPAKTSTAPVTLVADQR